MSGKNELEKVGAPIEVDMPKLSLEDFSAARALKIRLSDGTELEIPIGQVTVEGSRTVRGHLSRMRYTKCGNCQAKLPVTGDPEKDHHIVMKHAVEDCPKRAAAMIEQRVMAEEFNEQPHVVARTQPPPDFVPMPKSHPWWKFYKS